jgi:U3 small nucleolar RNA-associated protein 15
MEFKKLHLKQLPQIQSRDSSEAKYWKSFRTTFEDKLQGSPESIHFNPADNSSYIVTAGTKINLYLSLNDSLQRGYSRFQDDCFCARFRKDGKLIVAGDKKGIVKVFDTQSKAMLRQLKRHKSAVRTVDWSIDGLHMFSAGDDCCINQWDLGTQEVVWSASEGSKGGTSDDMDVNRKKMGHTDYIRCLAPSPVDANLLVSGSYDHSVKMWDLRQKAPAVEIKLKAQVESVLLTGNGGILATASGNEVQLWDMLTGGRALHTFSNHQKNVTSLCWEGTGSRLLSTGLDGHVKMYNMQTLQVAHGLRLGRPLLSAAMSADNQKLVLGYVDGGLSARTRRVTTMDRDGSMNQLSTAYDSPAGSSSSSSNGSSSSSSSRMFKGAGLSVSRSSMKMLESERSIRLRPYEAHLKSFSYQQALDAALRTHNPLVVVTVLEELSRRSGLGLALSGRDEQSLEPLLAFVARYITHPRHAQLVIQVTQRIIDLYCDVLGRSDSIDELFLKLQRLVRAEVRFQREALKVMGALDGIVCASTICKAPSADMGSSSPP